MVTGVFVEEGETVISGTTNIAGSTMLTIADPSAILSKVYVDEADIANVSVDQKARVYAAAYPDTPFKGVVESVATTARQVTGRQGLSFEVEIRLQPETGNVEGVDTLRLRPGMSARAEIFTKSAEDTLAVPIQAVLYPDYMSGGTDSEDSPYVFVVENGVAVKTPVELGISTDRLQQIKSGIALDDKVITGPIATLRHLQDQTAVTIEQTNTTAAEDSDEESAAAKKD
ncbi:MAG TPA: HlyD family efflux transporter periplasmic adaptor subunit, partial [Gammaproteobacteria bacterium]|nr:HlyD family efflux transporter periplasmic adaptor subunit [Gammaproteobacteria bacterium]